jgi:hypothetical protein
MNKDMMQSLVGKILRVDRGGAESRVGKLLAVGEDYFTLMTKEDGVIFDKTHTSVLKALIFGAREALSHFGWGSFLCRESFLSHILRNYSIWVLTGTNIDRAF